MSGIPGFRFRSIRDRLETRLFRNSKPSALTRLRPTARKASLRRRRRIWLPNQIFWEDRSMLSRRIFVTTALGAGAVLATKDHKAAAQVDRRMFVDAQIHLWKAESEDWRWVPGLQPQLPEPFTIERAISMMDEAGVDRAVIVPPSWPGDRNDYALEAVKRYPTRFRVMGKVPL